MSSNCDVILKGNKLKLYPTNDQIHTFMCMFGNARFVWNKMLEMLTERHANNKHLPFLSEFDLNNLLSTFKLQFEFLKISDKSSFEIVNKNLVQAFKMFFKQQFGYPRFHSRKSSKKSYSGTVTRDNVRVIDKHHVQLPKVGKVYVSDTSCVVEHKIKCYTVTLSSSGKFFLSVNYECDKQTFKKTGKQVGIDLNEHTLAVTSDSHVYASLNVKPLERKLAIEQRKLSQRYQLARTLKDQDKAFKPKYQQRELTDFKNYQRQRKIVARIYEKIRNKRYDYIQKITTQLVNDYDVIVLEKLNTKGLMKNHKNAHKLANQAWFEFRRQLEYKCQFYGKIFVLVDPKNTSRICSACGQKNVAFDNLSTNEWLHVRQWICPNCDTYHDRDVNAANNILNRGLAKLAEK